MGRSPTGSKSEFLKANKSLKANKHKLLKSQKYNCTDSIQVRNASATQMSRTKTIKYNTKSCTLKIPLTAKRMALYTRQKISSKAYQI